MNKKRFIQNKSLEEDSFVISDGVIDREKNKIIRYDKDYCEILNKQHETIQKLKKENEYYKTERKTLLLLIDKIKTDTLHLKMECEK